MPDDRNATMATKHRARFANLRVVLLVESVAIAALVAGSLWLIQDLRQGGQIASGLLNVKYWLLVLAASGFGTFASLGPYYLGQRGTEAVFERFPKIAGDRWGRIDSAFQSWGARTLILTGIPGVGMALIASAGALGIRRSSFLVWTLVGKVLRNWVLLLGLLYGFRIFGAPGSS